MEWSLTRCHEFVDVALGGLYCLRFELRGLRANGSTEFKASGYRVLFGVFGIYKGYRQKTSTLGGFYAWGSLQGSTHPEGPTYTTIVELGPQNPHRDGFGGA